MNHYKVANKCELRKTASNEVESIKEPEMAHKSGGTYKSGKGGHKKSKPKGKALKK